VLPTPVVKPQLVAGAGEVAELIGLDPTEFDTPKFASVFGGNEVLPGMQPHAMIREFLCSEAMFHLGVPTTRALSLVLTGQRVMRDMMYDGNARLEPGAIVCRVAPNFIRFGNFQIFAARGDAENLKRLVDFTIENYFPHLGPPSKEVYAAWFAEVCERTCAMVVDWMRCDEHRQYVDHGPDD